eukprot:7847376-Pyramimonas_sp.AAC.2
MGVKSPAKQTWEFWGNPLLHVTSCTSSRARALSQNAPCPEDPKPQTKFTDPSFDFLPLSNHFRPLDFQNFHDSAAARLEPRIFVGSGGFKLGVENIVHVARGSSSGQVRSTGAHASAFI